MLTDRELDHSTRRAFCCRALIANTPHTVFGVFPFIFLLPPAPALQASRNTVVALQSGDPACKEVWTLLCDISRKEFQKVYDRLGVTLEEHGESFYNDMIPSTIDMLGDAGLVSRDDGADIVRLEGFSYPLIVRKRDGEHLAFLVPILKGVLLLLWLCLAVRSFAW